MYNVLAIVPRGQGIGFNIAGVRVCEAADKSDAIETLISEMDNDENGLILIDEMYMEGIPQKLQKKVDESTVPLVVSVPIVSQWEYIHDQDERFEQIIHRAIGYRIKIFGDSD